MSMFKKISLAVAAIATSLTMTTAFAFAQNAQQPMSLNINNDGKVHMTGTVTAVSGNTISVSSWGGTWTVNSANATFTPGNTTISSVTVGQQVRISGTIASGMNINAQVVHNAAVKSYVGTVSNMNSGTGTFTLTTEHGTFTVNTSANTKIMVNGSVSTLANISNNTKVTIVGTMNTGNTVISAISIKAPASASVSRPNIEEFRAKLKAWLNELKADIKAKPKLNLNIR